MQVAVLTVCSMQDQIQVCEVVSWSWWPCNIWSNITAVRRSSRPAWDGKNERQLFGWV